MTCEIASDDHLNLERLALVANGDGRIRYSDLPVRKNVRCGVKELGRDAVQHLSLVRNTLRQNHIKR